MRAARSTLRGWETREGWRTFPRLFLLSNEQEEPRSDQLEHKKIQIHTIIATRPFLISDARRRSKFSCLPSTRFKGSHMPNSAVAAPMSLSNDEADSWCVLRAPCWAGAKAAAEPTRAVKKAAVFMVQSIVAVCMTRWSNVGREQVRLCVEGGVCSAEDTPSTSQSSASFFRNLKRPKMPSKVKKKKKILFIADETARKPTR